MAKVEVVHAAPGLDLGSSTHGQSAQDRVMSKHGVNKETARMAVLEVTTMSIFVLLCMIGLTLLMSLIQRRLPPESIEIELEGETPEEVWGQHNVTVKKYNMCMNFPSSYAQYYQIIEKPYQAIGDACSDYYSLVCSGICHILPYGLCFKEVFVNWYSQCQPDMELESQTLWRNFFVFLGDSVPDLPTAENEAPVCSRLLNLEFGSQLNKVSGGSNETRRQLLNRIAFLSEYLSSQHLCVGKQLRMFELFCLSLCCNDSADDAEVKLNRVICQSVVSWRTEFTAFFRCQQNNVLIEYCELDLPEPDVCTFV